MSVVDSSPIGGGTVEVVYQDGVHGLCFGDQVLVYAHHDTPPRFYLYPIRYEGGVRKGIDAEGRVAVGSVRVTDKEGEEFVVDGEKAHRYVESGTLISVSFYPGREPTVKVMDPKGAKVARARRIREADERLRVLEAEAAEEEAPLKEGEGKTLFDDFRWHGWQEVEEE